jgi:hypothetical protein
MRIRIHEPHLQDIFFNFSRLGCCRLFNR